jgi:hypothetical protein
VIVVATYCGMIYSPPAKAATNGVSNVGGESPFSITGRCLRIQFDPQAGTWTGWDTSGQDAHSTGRLMLSEMAYSCGEFKSTDAGYVHSARVADIDDPLGRGRELTVRSKSTKGLPTLILRLRLYDNSSFIVCGAGLANTTDKPIHLKAFTLAEGFIFPDTKDLPNLRLLTGISGGGATRVVNRLPVSSQNNILMTFGRENDTRSLAIGGLTYVDFEKEAAVVTGAGGGARCSIRAHDPVGKRMDPGTEYVSIDLAYIDLMTRNPFEAAERYGRAMCDAMHVRLNYYTFPSVCMWFISVSHFGGDPDSVNDTPGAVREMDKIVKSGFLKYSPVAVRLVPDCYEPNNEQGWWDDEHWQMHGRKERCVVVGGHYKAPYETTAKWCDAIRRRGGIPFTYFQPGVRSEDYAEAFPGHMLFNEAHRYILGNDGKPQIESHGIRGGIYKIQYQEAYDYTDPGFLTHLRDVYANLAKGGLKGIFYDYPDRAYPARGGMEDGYSTAGAAYRIVYSLARDALGPVCYLQERLAWGSDLATGLIDSQRTQGDSNVMTRDCIRKAALRWYKNRTTVSYDMDGKALVSKGRTQSVPIGPEERRAILTMNYAVSARLLLTETFSKMSPDVLHDLSRTIPYHATTLSARPLDAFVREFPAVFDFPISDNWHQLVLCNDDPQKEKGLEVRLAGDTAFGAMGLDPNRSYYCYDFWNDSLAGKLPGRDVIKQRLRAGEARVLSVHAVEGRPQWLSTDRHIMQGYVELVSRPTWNQEKKTLSAVSRLVAGEPYHVVLALNGYRATKAATSDGRAEIKAIAGNQNLISLELVSGSGSNVVWTVSFQED